MSDAATAASQRARLLEWRWLLVPMLAGIAAWAPSLRGEFVWDDWIFQQRWVLGTNTLRGMFLPDPTLFNGLPYYKPVWALSSYVLLLVFGKHAWGWRLASLLLHLATTAGIAVLAQRFLKPGPDRRRIACLAATVFAAWPPLCEALGWISARGDILIAFFMVWGLFLHLRARDTGARPFFPAILFLLAMLSKETALAFLPSAVVASILLPAEEGVTEKGLRATMRWRLWLPYSLALVVYIALRHRALGSSHSLSTMGGGMVGTKLLRPGFYAWGYYVRETLLLGRGAPYFEYVHYGALYAACAVAGIAGLIAAAVAALKPAGRPCATAVAWFLFWIGPAVAVSATPSSITPVAMRYLYAPSVAVALLAALAFEHVPRTWTSSGTRRAILVVASVAALGGMIAADQRRVAPWLTDQALWTRALQDEPLSVLGWGNLGLEAARHHRVDEAETDFRIAAWAAVPLGDLQRVQSLSTLARFYLSHQRYDMARNALLEASRYSGTPEGTASNLTTASVLELLIAKGPDQKSVVTREKLRQHVAALEEAADLDPYNQTSLLLLGIVFESLEEPVRAKDYYERFIRVNIDHDAIEDAVRGRITRLGEKIAAETDPVRKAYYRAETMQQERKIPEALAAYREASELAPDRVDLLSARASLEAATGDLPRAEELMLRATGLSPRDAVLWVNLGTYQARQKKFLEAAVSFETAQGLAPSWPKPYLDAGHARDLGGDKPAALRNYEAFLARYRGHPDVSDEVVDRVKALSAVR